MTIAGALKKVITNLGGTPTKKTVEGLINEVADNVGSGGSGGGGGGGGGGVYVFTALEDVEAQTLTINELSENIFDACQNGTVVIVSDAAEAQSTLAIISSIFVGNRYLFVVVMPSSGIEAFVGAAGENPVFSMGD